MNYRLSIAFLILMVLSSASRLFAEDHMKRGKAALESKNYLEAIKEFRDAVSDDRKNVEAYLLLATSLLKVDSTESTLVVLFQAREVDTSNARIFELLGDVYAAQKILAAAAEQYRNATLRDSARAELWVKLAEAYRHNRQYGDAAGAYVHVLALDSNNVQALRNVGDIYLRAKQKLYANALPIFERLSRLQPDSLHVQIQYARSLYGTNNFTRFIPVGDKIVKIDPAQNDISEMLADAYIKTGKIDSAINAYRSVRLESLPIDKLISLAKAYKAKQIYDSAASIYARAYKKDSSRCDIPYDYGTVYMALKKWPDAVGMFARKIACDTSSAYQFASHYNAAVSLMQYKQFKDALEHIKKCISFRPEYVQAWVTLARCNALIYAANDAATSARSDELEAYRKVIELALAANSSEEEGKYNKELVESYIAIGVSYLTDASKIKDAKLNSPIYAKAAENLKRALAIDARNCQALLWCGESFQNSNNKEEAKRYYRKVMELCPNSKEAVDAEKYMKLLGD